MNYWSMQLHPGDSGWNREKELLEKHSVIGLGDWKESAKQQPDFENIMQKGDIVIVKHGGTIIALVEVTGDYEYNDKTDDLLWFQRRRSVRVLDWYDVKYGYSVSQRKTLERCSNHNTSTYQSIIQWLTIINQKTIMNTYKTLLEKNFNLILTGAPGTGKTYLAKQIAAQMILGKDYDEKNAPKEEKDKMNEQCDFVQFHPSFDYTDFVEGLRPIEDENGNVSFRREDGIFMKFCRRALATYINAKDKKNTPKYVFIIDEINRGELSKIFGELFFCIDPGYRGEKGKVKTQYYNLWKNDSDASLRNYGGSEFFFIPENVYIIGTMNDIDRSVESMDFAFRRRFAFKEIKASKNLGMLNDMEDKDKIIQRMNNLNAAIEKVEGLSSAYHIGGSYFMKLKLYHKDDKSYDYEALWNNHLKGLLMEYVRGMADAEKKVKELKEYYDLKQIASRDVDNE